MDKRTMARLSKQARYTMHYDDVEGMSGFDNALSAVFTKEEVEEFWAFHRERIDRRRARCAEE